MFFTVALVLLQIVLGLFYGNLMEWTVHKYVLHHIGKKKGNAFNFHWFDHHRKSRLNKFQDDDYEQNIWNWNARGKEALGLGFLWLTHVWLFFFFPVFALTITYCVINYYFTHKWSHQNPEWAKKHLRWHWEHHMGKVQDANYCVTQPWCDYLFRTRIHYRQEQTKSGKTKLVPVQGSIF